MTYESKKNEKNEKKWYIWDIIGKKGVKWAGK